MRRPRARAAPEPVAVPAPGWLDAAARVRVAILSDTHGVLDGRVARAAARCEVVVHAGDVGGAAVLDTLAASARLLVAVRGNNDTDGGSGAALPEAAAIDLPGGRLVVTHGHRAARAATRHAWLRAAYPHARAIAYGHSHRRVLDRDTAPWVLNPGAAGRARTFGGPSLLVLEAARARWRVYARRYPPPA